MGRPKLSDTGSGPRTLSVRWSEEHHIMFLQLGGSKWLRSVVAAEIDKRRATHAAEQTSKDAK